MKGSSVNQSYTFNPKEYLANYARFDWFLDENTPTRMQIQQSLEEIENLLPECSLISIVSGLSHILAGKQSGYFRPVSNPNLEKSEATFSINEELLNDQISERQLFNAKYPMQKTQGNKKVVTDYSYEYDPTAVPEYKKLENTPTETQVVKDQFMFNNQERYLPEFNQNQPFTYSSEQLTKQKWEEGPMRTQLYGEDQHKFLEKQLAARALVYRGYGFPRLKELLHNSNSDVQIDSNRYKIVSSSMILDVYKKIEEYVDQKFPVKYLPLSAIEFRPLYAIMFNGLARFEPQKAQTLRKLIIITFSLEPRLPEISPYQVMELFRFLMIKRVEKMSFVDSRGDTCNKNSFFRIHNEREGKYHPPTDKRPDFWTIQKQVFMINVFCRERTLKDIKAQFHERYAETRVSSKWFDYNFIKNKMDKIFREVLRKIEMIIPKESIHTPKGIKINDASIKQIAKSPYSISLKTLLAQIYRDDSFNIKNIKEVLRLMTIFFENMRNNKLE